MGEEVNARLGVQEGARMVCYPPECQVAQPALHLFQIMRAELVEERKMCVPLNL